MLYVSFVIWAILLLCVIFEYIALIKYKEENENNKSYIATVTHDLKSPTYAQINMLNMLLKGRFGQLNPEQYEMIKLTQSSSKYMSNLVGTILTNYECESNAIKLNITEFDIIKLINKICDENNALYKDKNQELIFEHRNYNSCIVKGDELQIERVIYNLLSNAVIYGLNNSKIKISLKIHHKNIIFTIKNFSNPIPNKNLKNIFNKFSKSQTSKFNKNSTGLGLYVSKRIIQMHKGQIFAHCNKNGIYTFGFILKNNFYNFEKNNIKKKELL